MRLPAPVVEAVALATDAVRAAMRDDERRELDRCASDRERAAAVIRWLAAPYQPDEQGAFFL